MSNQLYWVALATQTSVGGATLRRLLRAFASLEGVLNASREDLLRVRGIGPATADDLLAIDLEVADHALRHYSKHGIRFISLDDLDHYPTNLLYINDSPAGLFVQGDLQTGDGQAVAIVGTRTPHADRQQLAFAMGRELAARGWVIVSGLAFGIDAATHQGALAAGGRTIAVLGSGLLNLYPPQHRTLAQRITAQGAVLCEVAPEAKVSPRRLIARNRLTSGLAKAVIVVEAGEDSGSISTARRAIKQRRGLLAVAGDGAGCDSLIADGAQALEPHNIDYDRLSKQLGQLPMQQQTQPDQPPLF